jgi:uncharacterized protein (TIGR04255 family)
MAAKQRHLARAPIREAVIELRVPPTDRLAAVEKLADQLKGEFDERLSIWEGTFDFSADPGGAAAKSDEKHIGVRLDKRPHVLQITTKNLALSRLPPYEDWGQIRAEAKRHWDRYVELVNPEAVVRFSVRYINAMPLPAPGDLSKYLASPPQIPPELPQDVPSFVQQTVIADVAGERVARVTQALDPSFRESNKIQVLLDIDAAIEGSFDPRSDDIWRGLDRLRDFKNQIFFAYIEEPTARLFE